MSHQFTDTTAYQEALVEAWGDTIDPLDALRSEQGFFSGLLGGHDRPDSRRNGDNWPHWDNEHTLAQIRATGTHIAETDPTAINIVQTLVSYVIGEGLTPSVTPKEGQDGDDAVFHAEQVISEFLDRTGWTGGLDAELFERRRKAGERFVRLEDESGGYASIEIVEPAWVTEPRNSEALVAHYGYPDLAGLEWKYGIGATPRRPADVRAYFVSRYGDPDDIEIVPAGRMSHVMSNVDTGIKRGLTDFYGGAEQWMSDGRKTLRNIIRGAGVQAAIAYIRKHNPGTSREAIESAAQAHVEFEQITRQPDGDKRKEQVEQWRSGTVVDTQGYDAMYGPMGTPVGPQLIQTVEAALRYAGRRWGFPEDMMSGNASGTNFASILEAHTPFTILMKRAQIGEACALVELLWMVLDIACEAGRIPYTTDQLRRLIKVEARPGDIETRDQQLDHNIRKEQHEKGLLSRQTWSEQENLDFDTEQRRIAEEPPVVPSSPAASPAPGPASPVVEGVENPLLRFSVLGD